MAFALVLDTETAPTPTCKGCDATQMRVYDLGWAVVDTASGDVVETFNGVVRETWENTSLMTSAYYAGKLPWYRELITRGALPVMRAQDAQHALADACERWDVNGIWAWNVRFDYQALNATIADYSNGYCRHFTPKNVKCYDIMSVAAMSVCDTKKYRAWCGQTGNTTPKGKPRTTAEAVHRYLSGDDGFVESHTALDDARIEAATLHACYKRHAACKKWGARWGLRCK